VIAYEELGPEAIFKLEVKDKILDISGKQYQFSLNYKLIINNGDNDVNKVGIYQKYIPLLDDENYTMVVCSNKVFLKSKESSALIIFALCAGLEDED
jgi:hypothetical protein